MAQNITLLNASYSDVPAVTLPKTGGGTAKFTDVTPTTATDADVASGKIYFKADGTQSTGTNAGGITPTGNINITTAGTTDVTNYATATVATGGATASASKGTVTNHSITVTPSVTRTAGYITAGSANGTAVTVSASELVSGSETKTANGTYDVTNLAELVVNVSGGGGGASNFVQGSFTTQSTTGVQTINVPYTGSGYPIAMGLYPSEGAAKTDGSFYTSIPRYALVMGVWVKSNMSVTPTYTGTTGDGFNYVGTYRGSSQSGRSAGQASVPTLTYGDPSASGSHIALTMSSKNTLKVFVQDATYGLAKSADYSYFIIYSS